MGLDNPPTEPDVQVFERLRSDLTALAYRMLGDVAASRDIVQEAWLRWQGRGQLDVLDPKAFLVTVATRLCLNELGSARARLERSRPDRLPEPIDLASQGLDCVEAREQMSMAFLVLLERLTPVERAVFLLHEVFDFSHEEVARAVARNAAASRKLLERARRKVAQGRRLLIATPAEHERLFQGFLRAAQRGDMAGLLELLADDAVIVTDGGSSGRRFGGLRNLPRPLRGAARVAAFVAHRARRATFDLDRLTINGQPALAVRHEGEPFGALLLGVAGGKIQEIYFHADRGRLTCIRRS